MEWFAFWIKLAFQKHHCRSNMEDGLGRNNIGGRESVSTSDLVKTVVMGLERSEWI